METNMVLEPIFSDFTISKGGGARTVKIGIILTVLTLYLCVSTLKGNLISIVIDTGNTGEDSQLVSEDFKLQQGLPANHEEKENGKCYTQNGFAYENVLNHISEEQIRPLTQSGIGQEKVAKRNYKVNKASKLKYANKSLKTNSKLTRSKRSELKTSTKKKLSSADPIIYLLALVFIYFLIKAASDINQHYKLEKKKCKSGRRCSLQSYAIAQRSRRASKTLSPKCLSIL